MDVSGKKGMKHKEVGGKQTRRWEEGQKEGGKWVGGKKGNRQVGGVGRSCKNIIWGQGWPKKKIQKGCLGKKTVNWEKKIMKKKAQRK